MDIIQRSPRLRRLRITWWRTTSPHRSGGSHCGRGRGRGRTGRRRTDARGRSGTGSSSRCSSSAAATAASPRLARCWRRSPSSAASSSRQWRRRLRRPDPPGRSARRPPSSAGSSSGWRRPRTAPLRARRRQNRPAVRLALPEKRLTATSCSRSSVPWARPWPVSPTV